MSPTTNNQQSAPKKPPKIFLRFFRWYCHPRLVDHIEGDLLEDYGNRLKKAGKRRADIRFIVDVLLLFRPGIIKPAFKNRNTNHFAMFKNYFLIGWRAVTKQKMYSFIKIGGFAIGIAACFLIALFIREELSYDRNYPDGDRIYRVVGVLNLEGEIDKNVHFPAPMATALEEDYPEIEAAGRYNDSELFGVGHAEIRRGDELENSYEEGVAYFDQELLDILDLPVVSGNPNRVLAEPQSVVITKSKAVKYFGDEDPIGKTLIFHDDDKNPYTIGGVIEDLPSNSHLHFDFLLTMTGKELWQGEQQTWTASNYATYIKVQPGTDIMALEKKISKGILDNYFLPMMLESGMVNAHEFLAGAHLELQPIQKIHLYSSDIDDRLVHGDIKYVWLFGAIALFILVIAIINFVNLSTAKSANRAKEVGLRKVVGSVRGNLIYQFLTESMLFSLLSFGVGLIIAVVLLPYFNLLSGKSLAFPWDAWWLIPVFLTAIFFVGILSGIYPSFYLSSFKPIRVLKGDIRRGSKSSSLRSALVIFQFATSIVLIVCTLIVKRQMDFILETKVGFEKEQVLLLQGTNTLGEKLKTLKEEIKQLPNVQSVSISDFLPIRGTKRNGNQFFIEGKRKVDEPVAGQFWIIDEDYINTLGMNLVAGRNFDADRASDKEAVIINQRMAKELGLEDPINARIQNWQAYTVIGVVEDFHFESLRQGIEPLAMRLDNSNSIVSVKINSGDMAGTIGFIANVWKKNAPHQPIRYTFLDQSYARMYEDVQRMGRIFTSCAVLAIIVACLGLFALSAFMVEQRSKEISIRLVLGASLNNVLRLLMQNFIILILISLVIASPIAWYLMKSWLNDFVYKIDIGWSVFLVSGILALAIALITISYQSIRAALTNPVNSLKSE